MSLHLFDKEKPFESDGVHPKGFYYPLWAKQMATYLLQIKAFRLNSECFLF